MTPRDLINLQLDAFFGTTMPQKVQALVDAELNEGKWQEGYDLAINSSGLSESQGQELLNIVLSQHPELKIDRERLLSSVEQKLPQSFGAQVLWLASDDGTFVLTDSLRVARYRNATPLWVTPRISYDGIEFDSIDSQVVKGRAFWLGSFKPDSPFILNFETGEVIDGQIVEQ